MFPDKPTANPQAVSLYGYATDVVPEDYTLSPRAGFNWDLSDGGTERQQVRGSLGYFGGRTPYVWLSNQYGNTGIEFRRLAVAFNTANRVAFVPDPNNQPTNVGGAASNEIDVIDPDYSYPKTIRGNIAYDRGLPFGLVGYGGVPVLASRRRTSTTRTPTCCRQRRVPTDARSTAGSTRRSAT